MDRTKIRMSNINFHKLIVLIRVPPRTHLQKERWLVEAGWGGGGVFKVKSSDLANVYGKFNIGLEHCFSKTQPPPPPSTPHTHTYNTIWGKMLDHKPDNGLIFNLKMCFDINFGYGDMHGEYCLHLLFSTRSM